MESYETHFGKQGSKMTVVFSGHSVSKEKYFVNVYGRNKKAALSAFFCFHSCCLCDYTAIGSI